MDLEYVNLCISSAVGLFCIWNWRRQFARKPSKRLLRKLRNTILVRYTSEFPTSEVHFQARRPPDFSTKGQPVVYFFVGEPGIVRRMLNDISYFEAKYRIPFSYLDPEKVLYRPRDKVIAYKDDYKGVPLEKVAGSIIHGKPYAIATKIVRELKMTLLFVMTAICIAYFLGTILSFLLPIGIPFLLLISFSLGYVFMLWWFRKLVSYEHKIKSKSNKPHQNFGQN